MFPRCLCFNYLKYLSCHQNFSSSNIILKNHYDSLGITPKATQTDIKSAYYKLSMLYHPDKNKGSTDASKRFQDISAAYEVLGNFKLRKLYDKGILHTAGERFAQAEPVTQEHPEEKFYRSRKDRHTAPNMSGRTPIYDFDEWSKAHYGTTFERANRAKIRYHARVAKLEQERIDIKNEMVIMGVVSLFFVCMVISYMNETGYDNINKKNKNSSINSTTID